MVWIIRIKNGFYFCNFLSVFYRYNPFNPCSIPLNLLSRCQRSRKCFYVRTGFVFVEWLFLVIILAEIRNDLVECTRFQVAGYGLDELKFLVQKNRRWVAHLVLHQRGRQLMNAPASPADVFKRLLAQRDVFGLLGIEFYRVKILVDVIHDSRLRESFAVHYFTPTAPIGVDVDNEFFGRFLSQGIRFLNGEPLNAFGRGRYRTGRTGGERRSECAEGEQRKDGKEEEQAVHSRTFYW